MKSTLYSEGFNSDRSRLDDWKGPPPISGDRPLQIVAQGRETRCAEREAAVCGGGRGFGGRMYGDMLLLPVDGDEHRDLCHLQDAGGALPEGVEQ